MDSFASDILGSLKVQLTKIDRAVRVYQAISIPNVGKNILQCIANNILELVVHRAFSTCQHRSSGSSRMTCRTIWKDSWGLAMTLGKIGKSGWAGKVLALGTTRHT